MAKAVRVVSAVQSERNTTYTKTNDLNEIQMKDANHEFPLRCFLICLYKAVNDLPSMQRSQRNLPGDVYNTGDNRGCKASITKIPLAFSSSLNVEHGLLQRSIVAVRYNRLMWIVMTLSMMLNIV